MLKLMSASVGLCTYNAQRHLAKQLDSILQQTHPVAEIVVIDDVSTDGTQDLLNDYATRYPGIFRLEFNSVNQGAKKNFERLLAECQGDAIFLSDHDDIWAPQKCRVCWLILIRIRRTRYCSAMQNSLMMQVKS
ncbi:glycosyltransferase [Chitinophaga sedimenti]|uniref:glycosyltransferase n=1 Tax=Chitinophaga sedimenti TaxID=2033606 RepID=UPI002005E061|nr:glycosyltransferase [Chitinophaga sedimenti]MCK7560174.1 glycosyltransferase [Chitinophaga sedimenti]